LQTAQVSGVAHPDIAAVAQRDALCDPAAIDQSMPREDVTRPVFLPVILGTPRQGRLTKPPANFVFGEVSKRSDIETELIDTRKIPIRMDNAGEALKDSHFSATVASRLTWKNGSLTGLYDTFRHPLAS
jgi:hypothetical protein